MLFGTSPEFHYTGPAKTCQKTPMATPLITNRQLGANLQLHRTRLGLRRDECAGRLGVAEVLLIRWENGQSRITPEDMWLMKLRLDLNPSDLLAGVDIQFVSSE